jgi:hypothetical protein
MEEGEECLRSCGEGGEGEEMETEGERRILECWIRRREGRGEGEGGEGEGGIHTGGKEDKFEGSYELVMACRAFDRPFR